MAKSDFVERGDQELRAQLAQYLAGVRADPQAFGLTEADVAALEADLAAYDAALDEHVAARELARARTESKNAARAAAVARFRSQARRLQAAPNLPGSDLLAVGLTPHATHRARVPAPTVRPMLTIVRALGGQHVIQAWDSSTGRRTKPAGVRGMELFRKLVPPGGARPSGVDEMERVDTFSASRIVLAYDDAHAGWTAYYAGRYANAKLEKGPAGAVVGATIAA